MALDLQKVAIRRLLDTGDSDLYSKLITKYFSGANLIVFGKIQSFYKANFKLPTTDEFVASRKDSSLQEYLESQILSEENKNNTIRNEFLISQLQDFCIREETIDFLTQFLDKLEDLEKVEIVDLFQNHMLELNKSLPMSDELFDVALLDTFPKEGDFKMHPSGLSNEYDAVNGGFGQSELVLLGGRRGSGKSILALNAGFNRYLNGDTVGFFAIEMRYKEVYDRLLSLISGVPFLDILKNQLTFEQRVKMLRAKYKEFYIPHTDVEKALDNLEIKKDLTEYENLIKKMNPPLKENRFFIIDDPSLTLNRLDHFCNLFSTKYPRFTMGVVDYLNIVKEKNNKDWQVQITIAEVIKEYARKYDLTMLSPYQIDKDMEARFAKGILDSADRAFTFMVPEEAENFIKLFTTKIRNGRPINSDIWIDWECVKVYPDRAILDANKLKPAAMYGSDSEDSRKKLIQEKAKDV